MEENDARLARIRGLLQEVAIEVAMLQSKEAVVLCRGGTFFVYLPPDDDLGLVIGPASN